MRKQASDRIAGQGRLGKARSFRRMFFLPFLTEGGVHFVPKFHRQLVGLAGFVKRDGPANVIDHYLTRVAARHVFLEFLANGRVHRAIHVFVQHRQKFFALHV
jgi:hypothetical protein